jgi:hypothetical protein
MYKSLIFPLFFTFVSNSFAQKEPDEPLVFGDIKPEEIKMKRYEKDTAAAAVVLYSYGRVNDSKDVHEKIKIFKKEAFYAAQIEIHHRKNESVSDVEGVTYYYEDGKQPIIHRLKKENIFTEIITKNHYNTKFSLPNVREGCIIEFKYRINIDFYSYYVEEWNFQREFPTICSEFRYGKSDASNNAFAIINPIRKYDSHDIYQKKEVDAKGSTSIWVMNRWIQKDIPAIVKEKYAFHFEDFVSKVKIQYANQIPGTGSREVAVTNWKTFGEELSYSRFYGDFLAKTKSSKDIASKIIGSSNQSDPKDKMAAIYNWTINNTVWDKDYDLLSRDKKKDFYESFKGHSSEINLFLITLLREAGLKANPVILRTRSSGAINKEYPSLNDTDHTLAAVEIGGDTILLDAINKYMPMGMLSEDALNGSGFYMDFDKKIYKWIDLNNTTKTIYLNNITCNIDPKGKISGTYQYNTKGYGGLYARTGLENKDKDTYTKEKFKDFLAHGTAENIKLENQEDINALLKLSFDYTTTDYIQQSGDLIYLSPLLDFGRTENPFKLKERAYPIDFGYISDIQNSFTYNIPAGYKIEDLPKTARMQYGEDSSIKYDYLVSQTEGQIKITTKLSIKRTIIPSAGYENIKDFFNKIITKDAEQIVLKKI